MSCTSMKVPTGAETSLLPADAAVVDELPALPSLLATHGLTGSKLRLSTTAGPAPS